MTLGGKHKSRHSTFYPHRDNLMKSKAREFYLTHIPKSTISTITSRNYNVPTITPPWGNLIYFERELESQYNNPTNLPDLK